MIKRITFAAVGLVLLASPALAFAQTVDTSGLAGSAASCLNPAAGTDPAVTQAACRAFIQVLYAIIAQLIAARHTDQPYATIDQSARTQSSANFSITGTAQNSSSVIVTLISTDAGGNPYTGRNDWNTVGGYLQGNPNATTPAGNHLYSYTVAVYGAHVFSAYFSGIPAGTYTILVHNNDYAQYALAGRDTLTVNNGTAGRSYPTFALAPLPSNSLSVGRLLRFSVTAGPAGPINLNQFAFSVAGVHAAVADLCFYQYADSAYSILAVTGQSSSMVGCGTVTGDGGRVAAGFYENGPGGGHIVPAGTTAYFELRDTGGRGTNDGVLNASSVSTTLLGDGSAVPLSTLGVLQTTGSNVIYAQDGTVNSNAPSWTNG